MRCWRRCARHHRAQIIPSALPPTAGWELVEQESLNWLRALSAIAAGVPAVLTPDQRQRFVEDGYVRLEAAFDGRLAAECLSDLWSALDVDRDDPSTWTRPVVRILGASSLALGAAINTPRLAGAIDDVVGVGLWRPRGDGYGTFPIRFPSNEDPGDTGWHIDGSFGEFPDYKVNFASKGRALLLLMLFTDVGLDDAPTRIKIGSHLDVARALSNADPAGVSFDAATAAPGALDHPTAHATGSAGDVYLSHPFLVHAASWPHRGTLPRFIGQPCIHHTEGDQLGGYDYTDDTIDSAVKDAVRLATRAQPQAPSL